MCVYRYSVQRFASKPAWFFARWIRSLVGRHARRQLASWCYLWKGQEKERWILKKNRRKRKGNPFFLPRFCSFFFFFFTPFTVANTRKTFLYKAPQ
jgi:hypothetical protein